MPKLHNRAFILQNYKVINATHKPSSNKKSFHACYTFVLLNVLRIFTHFTLSATKRVYMQHQGLLFYRISFISLFILITSFTSPTVFARGGGLEGIHKQWGQISGAEGLCLSAGRVQFQRTVIELQPCRGRSHQQWKYNRRQQSIRNKDGRCLDVERGHNADGTRLILWECHGGDAQRFRYDNNRQVIRHVAGRCIDADSGHRPRQGARVQLWECRGNINQRFWAHRTGGGSYNNRHERRYDDYNDAEPHRRSRDYNDRYGNDNYNDRYSHDRRDYRDQDRYRRDKEWDNRWEDNRHRNDRHRRSKHYKGQQIVNSEGLCLGVKRPHKRGNSVKAWRCDNDERQYWTYRKGRIKNAYGYCLDVDGSDMHRNGGRVQIWECNNSPNQKWHFERKHLVNSGGGKCLATERYDDYARQNRVQVWSCRKQRSQRWVLR